MPVTDDQEATLRALLSRQFDEHERLLAALDPAAAGKGYNALVAAAFAVAADAYFPDDATKADVIEFVGEVRSRRESGTTIDPRIAERVLMEVVTGQGIEDIDPRDAYRTQLILLAALVAGVDFDEAGLNVFLGKARKLANQWV